MDDQSPAVELTGKVMIVAIVVLFIVVVFVLFLHLYAKWFWWRIESNTVPAREARQIRRRRRRLDFAQTQDPIRKGLDPSTLKSLPVLIFNPEDFKDGLECAVCISDITAGEKTRLLPKCNHGFHLECIDMWFESHSSCPLCRNPIYAESSVSGLPENDGYPTNVLFWGNDCEVSSGAGPSSSSSSQGMLVIDIPEEEGEELREVSPAARGGDEEVKSPVASRLKSFKRLLSMENRVGPCGDNAEQGQ